LALTRPLFAAAQGHADAQLDLAKFYYDGIGFEQDYEKAFDWFLQAANSGLVKAKYYTGMMYSKGWGTKKDYIKAYTWLYAATMTGESEAEKILGKVAKKLSKLELAEATIAAEDLLKNIDLKKRGKDLEVED